MKICVVGEGPVGLLTAVLFSYYKIKYKYLDLEIYIYRKRPDYVRRHVLKLNNKLIFTIESLLKDCHNCISQTEINSDELGISINCLETILFNSINQGKIVNIIEEGFNKEIQESQKYDHVFFVMDIPDKIE